MVMFCRRLASAGLLLLLLVACASEQPKLDGGKGSAADPVDFSGSWELDYSKSDNLQAQLNSLVREVRRQQERRAAAQPERAGPTVVVGGAGTDSGASIIGLARMADLITQSQLLEVTQGNNDILIKREGNFALSCEFYGEGAHVVETPTGSEVCGWVGHQLEFRIFLPEGLSIRHRLTLGPRGQRMNIASTVISDRVSQPFTLNRVYRRFDPEAGGVRCEQTLTRGRVCTTEKR